MEYEDDDAVFHDFPPENCSVTDQPQLSASPSSDSSPVPEISSENASSAVNSLLRRPSVCRSMAGEIPSSDSSISSLTSSIDDTVKMSSEGKNPEIHRNFNDDGKELERSESLSVQVSSSAGSHSVNEENTEVSTMTTAKINSNEGLRIKGLGAQLSFFVYSICLPLWFFYHSLTLVFHPFQTIKLGRAYMRRKLLGDRELAIAVAGPLVSKRVKGRKSLRKVGLRCGGLLWAASVFCIILCCLFVSSLIFSAFLMRFLVQEPVKMKEVLNFDYTKHSPEALMPILPASNNPSGRNCKGNVACGKTQSRAIPLHRQFQVIVSLTLPESEYNRKLGVFQVRVDSLSGGGDILGSSSRPCMLQFKSRPLRLLLTILKLGPLVMGYISESQTLNLKLKGFTEGNIPTARLRVTIEQRAEFNPGAGLPELYDASIILESQFSLFRRIIWYWRMIIYVWISMTLFMMQFLVTLVCFIPIILSRLSDGSANANSTSNDISVRDSIRTESPGSFDRNVQSIKI